MWTRRHKTKNTAEQASQNTDAKVKSMSKSPVAIFAKIIGLRMGMIDKQKTACRSN